VPYTPTPASLSTQILPSWLLSSLIMIPRLVLLIPLRGWIPTSVILRQIIPGLSVLVLFGLSMVLRKETNKFPISDELLNHQPQGHTTLCIMPHCIMISAILILVLLRWFSCNFLRKDIVGIDALRGVKL